MHAVSDRNAGDRTARPHALLLRVALSVVAVAAAVCAQQVPSPGTDASPPQANANGSTRLTTPDGSRFVLLPDATIPAVHWALASWADGADDPPALDGLALVTAQVSLNGTFATGSLDADAERRALTALDEAWQAHAAHPGDADLARVVFDRDREAAALGDRGTFQRALAALPCYRPEVVDRYPAAVFVLSTTAAAIPAVARLMVERRDDPAFRDLIGSWLAETLRRAGERAAMTAAPIYAEVLALELPTSPMTRLFERGQALLPRRAQAQATWTASQRPDRTVHVLLGDFDPDAARAALTAAFATPPADARPRTSTAPRPLQAQRRSVVRGMPAPMLAIAWVLPRVRDRHVLELTTRWLGDDDQGWLVGRLRRGNLRDLRVRCRAPWPRTESGQSLLLLELSGANVDATLTDAVLAACTEAAALRPDDGAFHPANMALQRDWNRIAADPRDLAVTLAETALLWPDQEISAFAPRRVKAAEVTQLLTELLRGQPVVVEGRP